MRTAAVIAIIILTTFFSKAQVVFKTIVPQEPVVEGESFRVQYAVEGSEEVNDFIQPFFKGFSHVRGPEIYTGHAMVMGKLQPIVNTVYTLKAMRPGTYLLQGAQATNNGKSIRSNDVWVKVISKQQAARQRKQNGGSADNSLSFLKPGQDPHELIRKYLFVSVSVNKKTCFAGQPVVATFKLYSRLRSKSDIVKNPGFYGFAVQDIINLDNKIIGAEMVKGELFDVHTIRQVQLYPLQAGVFMVDPMEIKSKVEFSRSAVSKKTEQEVVEGVFEEKEPAPDPDTEIVESSITTEPISINVVAPPQKNKPADFNGATGRFTITTVLEKNELARNEEGYYVIHIKGRGNFSQLAAPVIQWPGGLEGFEPVITDTLDKTKSPLEGYRTFRYPFVASKPGSFELPAISFSFFDPDSNRYKTISAKSLSVTINYREKEKEVIPEKTSSITEINRKASLVAAGIVFFILLLVVIYWFTRKKDPAETRAAPLKKTIAVDEILKPAYLMIPAADKDFYTVLQQCIFSFFQQYFESNESGMNKESLSLRLKEHNVSIGLANDILSLLQQCETGIYTGVIMEEDRESLVARIRGILHKLNSDFFQQV